MLLGCRSIDFFRSWIEFQYTKNMNWNTKFHLDHIKCCASYNFEDRVQQYQCFRWSNYQSLFPHDNLTKSAKIDYDLILEKRQEAYRFMILHQNINNFSLL